MGEQKTTKYKGIPFDLIPEYVKRIYERYQDGDQNLSQSYHLHELQKWDSYQK